MTANNLLKFVLTFKRHRQHYSSWPRTSLFHCRESKFKVKAVGYALIPLLNYGAMVGRLQIKYIIHLNFTNWNIEVNSSLSKIKRVFKENYWRNWLQKWWKFISSWYFTNMMKTFNGIDKKIITNRRKKQTET